MLFTFYREGLSSGGARLIARVDAERMTVARTYGIETASLSDLLPRSYADQGMCGRNVADDHWRTWVSMDSTPDISPSTPAAAYRGSTHPILWFQEQRTE